MKVISKYEANVLDLKYYFTGLKCKNGHIDKRRVSNSDCMSCRKERGERYKIDNREKVLARNKRYRENNKDKTLAYQVKNKERIAKNKREYALENADKVKEYQEKWRNDNKLKIREYVNDKNKNDTHRKTCNISRSLLGRVLKLTGKKKKLKTCEILGYTAKELRDHIESLFQDGMTWENHGEWHIDHIYPISLLIKQGVNDPAQINCLLNLQPLWAGDNLAKSNKFVG